MMADILAAPKGVTPVVLRFDDDNIEVGHEEASGQAVVCIPIIDSDGYALGSVYLMKSPKGDMLWLHSVSGQNTLDTMLGFVSAFSDHMWRLYDSYMEA